MEMEIPQNCEARSNFEDCNVQQEYDRFRMPKNSLQKKRDKLIKVCPFCFIKNRNVSESY